MERGTMHIADLKRAIEHGELPIIRQGFLILVSWPEGGTVHGWEDAIELPDALEDAARALQWFDDRDAAPRQLVTRLRRMAHGEGSPAIGDSYGSCAGYVLSNASLFRGAFWGRG